MLEIRIGYGDVVSGQMGIPMSASDFEAAKKDTGRGEKRESASDGPFSGFPGSAAVRDDYRDGLRR